MTLFTKIDKLKLFFGSLEAALAVVGGAAILSEKHPYWALVFLALARATAKAESVVREKQNPGV